MFCSPEQMTDFKHEMQHWAEMCYISLFNWLMVNVSFSQNFRYLPL